MNMFYKLDENKNVVQSSLEEWGNFIEGTFPTNHMHVADEEVNGIRISTIFMGICHNYNPFSNVPIVFETMVFKNGHDIYQDRYCTYQEAEEGHEKAVEWVKNGCKQND
jgi:hypothetical protein